MYFSCMECAGVLLDRAAKAKVIHLAGHAGGSPASLSTLLGSFGIPYGKRLGDVARTHRFKWSMWASGVMNSINHLCHLWCKYMLLSRRRHSLACPHQKDGLLLFCSMWVSLWFQNKKLALQVFFHAKPLFFHAPIYISETWRFKTYFFPSFELCVHSANMATFNPYFHSIILYSFSPRQTCYFSECQYIFISSAIKMLCFFLIEV